LRSSTASSEGRLERIALETSGLADPAAILQAIGAHPVLVHHIVISETVVCIDALHGLAQFRAEPLSRRQAAAADRLILTKLDEADAGETARLVATLRTLNPGARIEGAIKGSPVGLESCADTEPERLPDLDGVSPAPIFPTRLCLRDGVDWTACGVWLSALLYARGDDVMRVKGVIRTPAGRLLLQTVRKIVQSPEVLPPQEDREDDTIVVIGRGYQSADLRRSLERFAGVRRVPDSGQTARRGRSVGANQQSQRPH